MNRLSLSPRRALPFCLAACLLAAAPVRAQPGAAAQGETAQAAPSALQAQRAQTRARIVSEREALAQERQTAEAACYQRFAVEDCLSQVRARDRDAQTRLRREEQAISDAERRERTAERLRTIEEKQRAAQDAAASTAPRAPASRMSVQERASREAEARERAERQKAHAQAKAVENAQRATAARTREAEARERYEAKQKQAQERREKHRQEAAEDAAQGRKPAAGLPQP
ncbi:MAG: hypothetical protein J0H52_02925 [Comamonadaceae bacterium]|nr:hypothetical protein [Comamonadaceae bacterium]